MRHLLLSVFPVAEWAVLCFVYMIVLLGTKKMYYVLKFPSENALLWRVSVDNIYFLSLSVKRGDKYCTFKASCSTGPGTPPLTEELGLCRRNRMHSKMMHLMKTCFSTHAYGTYEPSLRSVSGLSCKCSLYVAVMANWFLVINIFMRCIFAMCIFCNRISCHVQFVPVSPITAQCQWDVKMYTSTCHIKSMFDFSITFHLLCFRPISLYYYKKNCMYFTLKNKDSLPKPK